MNYGLIFWGNSSHSVNIFKILWRVRLVTRRIIYGFSI
jgi:hypothetical protein